MPFDIGERRPQISAAGSIGSDPTDEAGFRRVPAQWNTYIGGDITPGTTSFRHDCAAAIDDEGLLRTDAAYWRLEIGPEETRDMRDGRYLIYGVDGSPSNARFRTTWISDSGVSTSAG